MVRFNDKQALRVQLQDWEGGYAEYADSLWNIGRIWSTEALASSPLETLSRILASGGEPLPYHSIHAADLIARAKAAPGEAVVCMHVFPFRAPHWYPDMIARPSSPEVPSTLPLRAPCENPGSMVLTLNP